MQHYCKFCYDLVSGLIQKSFRQYHSILVWAISHESSSLKLMKKKNFKLSRKDSVCKQISYSLGMIFTNILSIPALIYDTKTYSLWYWYSILYFLLNGLNRVYLCFCHIRWSLFQVIMRLFYHLDLGSSPVIPTV